MKNLLNSLSDIAQLKSINMRSESQLWETFSRDLMIISTHIEAEQKNYTTLPKTHSSANNEDRRYVRVKEASKIMGIGITSTYREIKDGHLPIKKMGRTTLISTKDIHAWFDALPSRE